MEAKRGRSPIRGPLPTSSSAKPRRTAFPRRSRTRSCARSRRSIPRRSAPRALSGSCSSSFPPPRRSRRDVGISCDENAWRVPKPTWRSVVDSSPICAPKFPVNPHLAVSAYNAGPGAPVRWIAARETDDFDLWVEQIPFEETRRYTKRVLASYVAYSFLYERNGLDAALRLPKVVTQAGRRVASRAE